MIYSTSLVEYARAHGMTGDVAYEKLQRYQWRAPLEWNTDRRRWVFGELIVEAGTNAMGSFKLLVELTELNQVFLDLGFDPAAAKYHLLVRLS